MKRPEPQTVYLGYMRFNKESSLIEGYVQMATAVNIHDRDFPVWEDISYGANVFSSVSSFEGFYPGIGPWGEPCLIFTSAEKAVKRLFEDIHGYNKYSERMEHYDIIRPNVFNNDEYPSIYFGNGLCMRLLESDEIIDILGGGQVENHD